MWSRLDRWQNNLALGITKETYLKIIEQLNEEFSEKKCPPDYEDFPLPLQQAIEVFNRLGDRVYPEIGYLGKDYTALPLHMKVAGVTENDLFLEALVRLDASMIKRSQEQLKQARKKASKPSRANVK